MSYIEGHFLPYGDRRMLFVSVHELCCLIIFFVAVFSQANKVETTVHKASCESDSNEMFSVVITVVTLIIKASLFFQGL